MIQEMKNNMTTLDRIIMAAKPSNRAQSEKAASGNGCCCNFD